MHILYLCEHPTLLGGERSLVFYLKRARRVGLQPVVAAPKEGSLAIALRTAGVEHLSWLGQAKRGELDVREGRIRDVEIVHSNSLSLAGVAKRLAERLGIPWVCHVRDVYRLSAAKVAELASADAIIAVSDFVRDWLLNLGLPPEKTHAIPNAIDRMNPIPEDTFSMPTFACIGQICLRKGQDDFLKAAERLASIRPDFRFVIVGERYSSKAESVAFEESLRRQASRGSLEGKVEFTGHLDDPRERLGEWTTIVSASRQDPLSRVLLEALAGGRVCVATDVGGTRQILDDGRLGWLVQAGDFEALAEAMMDSTIDVDRRAAIRREGPLWIEQAFSFERHHEAMERIYRSVAR